ncbi:MAG: hypothetical protein LKM35_08025 [Lachnospiraceae bacterium]|jgi:HlyD family secretion protein|nr:hypothetical protein [Lachnospiraceae bacterium]MCI1727598.1 hypothetical protein [Lachnospiraceae bacterium]
MKMKKTLLGIFIGIVCTVLTVFVIRAVRAANTAPVKVVAVSEITEQWYGTDVSMNGNVSKSVTQNIYASDDKVISKIDVAEGQAVDVGTPLVEYDMTLKELELESAQISLQSQQNKQAALEKELTKLKSTTPVPDPTPTPKETPAPEPAVSEIPSEDASSEETSVSEPTSSKSTDASSSSSGTGSTGSSASSVADSTGSSVSSDTDPTESSVSSGTDPTGSSASSGTAGSDSSTSPDISVPSASGDSSADSNESSADISGGPESDTETTITEVYSYEEEPDVQELDSTASAATVYTVSELKKAIRDKQEELSGVLLDIKQSNLDIANMQISLQQGTVKSTVKGTVKTLADPTASQNAGQPFLVVESSDGYYVKGVVSEFRLGDLSVGQQISGTAYESGTSFSAEVREISPYPDTASSSSRESYYPFLAFVADPTGLQENEAVSFNLTVGAEDSGMILIPAAFVRTQGGLSYVYKADSEGKLKKQDVTTGRTIYGYYLEIKSGVAAEDKIAFPYGNDVKDGARTVDAPASDFALY